MNGLRIYIEGGGDSQTQRRILRAGFQAFLSPLRREARQQRCRWDVILCGGRQATYNDYLTALRKHPDMINILLVDAESPVTGSPWQHLSVCDGWRDPGVGDTCCHLMVQAPRAWPILSPELTPLAWASIIVASINSHQGSTALWPRSSRRIWLRTPHFRSNPRPQTRRARWFSVATASPRRHGLCWRSLQTGKRRQG